jgi:hypothetical protein
MVTSIIEREILQQKSPAAKPDFLQPSVKEIITRALMLGNDPFRKPTIG